MQIGEYYFSKIQTLTFILLVMGTIIGLVLVQRQQNIKTRAAISESFKIYQNLDSPQLIAYQGTYPTKTLNLIIESTGFENQPAAPVAAKVTVPVVPKNSNLASCTFYRNGAGAKFRNSAWPGVISEVAGKVGVPASALAGILRIESPDRFSAPDNEFVTNDYDGHSSGVAYGLMQFVPSTFKSVFDSNRSEMQNSFGKTAVQTTLEPQKYPAPQDNILRITSIRDSLTAAAFKMRSDARMPPPYNRQAISNILSAYFGSNCSYEGGGSDYCTDLLRGINECGGI